MLKFIRIHNVPYVLEDVAAFDDAKLYDAYLDLKSEQISVQTKLTDLRIDKGFDKVREAALLSASRHIAFGIEYVQHLRKDRSVKLSDKFMDRARAMLDPEAFNEILEAVK